MKKYPIISFALFGLLALNLQSCCKDCDNENDPSVPTAQEFGAIRDQALANLTQTFQFNTADGVTTFVSEKGVELSINGNCLTLNGSPVTGSVELEFVELFDRGNMLTTNKATNGKLPDGNQAMLVSGGEFYINVTQNGAQLALSCGMNLLVPTALSGGDDYDMDLFTGAINDDGNMVWEEAKNAEFFIREDQGAGTGNQYFAYFNAFGWTNVDRFYSDPRPKTTIQVAVPEGYDASNCAVYLSYDGEPNALALLDTYDENTGLFSEHYGQIPIGLACHVIFASEQDGQWNYAIKGLSIQANEVITFAANELALSTEANLTQVIGDLP